MCRAPNGQIYDLSPHKSYKAGFIKVLGDVTKLPPSQCGLAIKCISKEFQGKWSISSGDAAGNWCNTTVEIKMSEKTCTNGTNPVTTKGCLTKKDCGPGKCCSDRKICVDQGQCRGPPPPPPPPHHLGCQTKQNCAPGKCCLAGNICGDCPRPGDCGTGWTQFKGSCYKLVKSKLAWAEAWHHCQDKENAHLASILSHEENCFVSSLLPASPRQPFWMDGRFIRDSLSQQNQKQNGGILRPTEIAARFIWTDGSKMDFTNWNKRSNPRNCSDNCPLGEPQDSPTNLCLHGAVDYYGAKAGKGKTAPPPNVGKGKGKGLTQPHCYTWGNQKECSERMIFVCKKQKSPCLEKQRKPARPLYGIRQFRARRF